MRAAGFLGLSLLGCATAPSLGPQAEARAGVEEGNRLFAAAALVGSGDRVATAFADDATMVVYLQPGAIHGHAAIADYWRERLSTTRFLDIQLTTNEVSVTGDLAYEIGTSRTKSQTGAALPVVSTGRYLAVWRRGVDGRWRIQADCAIPDPAPAR
jgi:ketosteroid isomerase-like protein